MQVRLFRPMARWVPLYMFLVGEMIFVTILEQLFNKFLTYIYIIFLVLSIIFIIKKKLKLF